MRAKNQKHHAWVFILSGLLLAGCAADVGKTIKVSGEQASRYGVLSAADAIAVLEKRVNEAKDAYMPFFAPNHFRGASEILSAARKSAEKRPRNELIGDIAKADAILDKGNAMMATVQTRLANEFALKIQLDKDNAARVYPREYEKSVSELSGLIEKIELGKADNIDKDKIELGKKMQALDIRTIQYTALHESDVINEDTEGNDGEDLAPVSFAEALRVYQDAMNRIAQSPHDNGVVQRAEADAMFAARHARNVNRRVIFLQKKYKKPEEAIVLDEEKRLLGISTALAHGDLRDRTLEMQAEEIAKAAKEIVQGMQKAKPADGAINDQSKPPGTPAK
ncbi:MAG: hypothetical protein NUV63_04780 [Gallionella sp.]|nr:hypothetical protein [Gallionella sp.]